ncbi:succinate dehydrogenase assembly factor 2 [Methylicorpusculum sp.]|uniref:FAD assembly factor SdhE n=1 Tax=Methylicorpusculum sp. TaxID=2713644 RepID=UPI00271F58EC|nr:succinate dehydrogenase assembly factor 2 [Methylicorpusculum sp.]MDO8845855.1 succinate dehydrogenase assembly factor 2 [Methylicorpusculum sp.]MDP2180916.1 succinate dehydrogenase assembly factor 2 [Methylicorpusculum sp.]MDP3528827.1 succinate dehydrogenase assembly factor 2 [Methylicorpusculum sp.]MDZ4149746.1 succinate dehydrogenase assembly factor 2 [Methylicorpusculum sp.]
MANLSQLRWQCRRGTLELDLMLMRYLEASYEGASPDEQTWFVQLLTLEDNVLMPLLMGEQQAEIESLRFIVKKIRSVSPS